ncbi:Cullin-4B [Blastocystis hominis]|uniref:Cullin-4B n=1 Tax=Blastocystis hominis TaxID=12968 RepID=D8LXX4_BLAHO|nr:Cullin-4B [Blastocystis hominis]CBK20429.2 Cullin-4B [Blastocystis hominis]|eukprot:XP_012894477.1 Cullin-4B [Blastocystis hominis]
MDTFWSTILRCIITVSSLLTHLSRGDQNKNLTTYCLNQIRSLLLSQESSLHIISRVIFFAFFSLQTNIAILKSVKQVREAVLRGLSSDSTMEIDFSYDANLQKIVANLVNMSDLLGFFPDLQQLYFRSVQTFYNMFAYELLCKSEIATFLSYVTQIVRIEQQILEGFFGNRGSEQIKAETLLGCLKLYGSEVLEKGMQKLVDESDFQNLGVLYEYFEIVGEVDLLKKAVCGVIESKKELIFGSYSVKEIVELIRINEECFGKDQAIALELQTTWMNLVNQQSDK